MVEDAPLLSTLDRTVSYCHIDFKDKLRMNTSGMPISGVTATSTCKAMLEDAMIVHLSTVSFDDSATTISTFHQKAVMRPDMIINTLMIAGAITTRGAEPEGRRLGFTYSLNILLADCLVLMHVV